MKFRHVLLAACVGAMLLMVADHLAAGVIALIVVAIINSITHIIVTALHLMEANDNERSYG